MAYNPHTDEDVASMLEVIGQPSIEALFRNLPEKIRLQQDLALPSALSEQEILEELEARAAHNASLSNYTYFLGAGTYPHFSPSAVDALISRSEFYTAYTPYQPEISQGSLQAIFEWQTMITMLTGLDAANASLYDGASAAAEAALMALRVKRGRKKVVVAGLHPHYREVLDTYLTALGIDIVTVPYAQDGRAQAIADFVDDQTACVLIQQPNFLGCVEDVQLAAQAVHEAGALLVGVVTEALSMALLRPLGELGADIVCGEAQSFGLPMNFGGPHLGFMATRSKFLRQMPGRLVGETVDGRGKRGFVLTLSTREQHIRREKATSNICTNQGLCLLVATIYLSLMGRQGLQKLARLNFSKAEYAKQRVRETDGLDLPLSAPSFNEFVIRVPDSAEAALLRAQEDQLIGGLDLTAYLNKTGDIDLGPAVLVCFTELAKREDIDRLCQALAGESA
jgi:glycine dehydrogenase subunit 1